MKHLTPEQLEAFVAEDFLLDEAGLRAHVAACERCARALEREAVLDQSMRAVAAERVNDTGLGRRDGRRSALGAAMVLLLVLGVAGVARFALPPVPATGSPDHPPLATPGAPVASAASAARAVVVTRALAGPAPGAAEPGPSAPPVPESARVARGLPEASRVPPADATGRFASVDAGRAESSAAGADLPDSVRRPMRTGGAGMPCADLQSPASYCRDIPALDRAEQ